MTEHRTGRARALAATAAAALLVPLMIATPAQAATPTPAQQWTDVQALIAPIKGTWTDQSYSGAISNTMPDTALLGNGDIGVTSGGGVGYKTFYVSKNDFWKGNPNPGIVALGGVTIAANATAGAPSNLALGATVTTSSSHPSFPGSRAVSGTWGSGYEGWVSNVGKPQSITLDLGSAKTFTRYVIRNDSAARPAETANNTKNFTFDVSTNGTSWSTIDTVTNNTAAVNDRTVASQTVRYVRLTITEPTQGTTPDSLNNPRARIGQFELYNGAGTPPATGPFLEEQNILKGDIDTTVTVGGVPVQMKTWTSANSNLIVTQVTSTGSAAVQLKTETFAGSTANTSGYTNTSGVVDTTAWATRTTPSGSRWVSKASLATRVIGATATASSSGPTAKLVFTLPAGGTVRIVTAVAGGGQNPADPAPAAWTLAGAQTASGLDTLYSQHVDWWKQYWLKSYVDFNDPVLERFYYGQLYLLGSASRAGKTAPALYGPWITTDSPQFSGDAHLNYNWQANFYGAYASNRPELALPMFDLVTAYLPEARRRAAQDLNRLNPSYVGTRFPSGGLSGGGVFFPVGIGPWGSTTDDNYWKQVSNSLFTVTQYVAYYDYTQDATWLSTTGYPFMKEVATFFDQYLEYNATTQKYVLYSGPHEDTWARNSTADIGMLKSLYAALVDASIDLGVDSGLRAGWTDHVNKLPAPATTTAGGQTVYALADPGTFVGGDTRAFRPGDNTVNLEFVHPGEQIGLDSTSTERTTAINTLNQMNSWGQDNSFPKVFTQAARVGYPAASLISQLKGQLNSKTAANLRVKDGNHGLEKAGALEALNNMMLQSDNGVIRVFPVWPVASNASFVKLREKDALLVSSALSSSRVQYVDITAEKSRTVKLLNPWGTAGVTITRVGGGSTPFTVSGGVITFSAAAGATYTVVSP